MPTGSPSAVRSGTPAYATTPMRCAAGLSARPGSARASANAYARSASSANGHQPASSGISFIDRHGSGSEPQPRNVCCSAPMRFTIATGTSSARHAIRVIRSSASAADSAFAWSVASARSRLGRCTTSSTFGSSSMSPPRYGLQRRG